MKVVNAHVYIQNSVEMRRNREEERDPEMEEGRGDRGEERRALSPPPHLQTCSWEGTTSTGSEVASLRVTPIPFYKPTAPSWSVSVLFQLMRKDVAPFPSSQFLVQSCQSLQQSYIHRLSPNKGVVLDAPPRTWRWPHGHPPLPLFCHWWMLHLVKVKNSLFLLIIKFLMLCL